MNHPLSLYDAYKRGDLDALKALLGTPVDFPNCRGPYGMGEIILEYAIHHSPLAFIRTLLDLGADPNYGDHNGFPSLIAALSCDNRPDRHQILDLLLTYGADVQQRGLNDYTPLHYAANLEDIRSMKLLLHHGADLHARTAIDDRATPLEEMEILGRHRSAAFLREAMLNKS